MKYSVISILTEPVLTFGILFLLILIVPILFQKIKLPGIVGLLLAGTIIGPMGFGLIETAGIIDVLGEIGLLYLMFLAGLGINMDQFKKEKKNTAIFGILTFLIPQTLGTLVFYWMGYPLASSLLVGCMIASHTLVGYPIITRMGLMKEKSVISSVGATIFTDIAALMALAVLARSVDGDLNLLFWVTLTGLFLLYLLFMFKVLPRFSFAFFQYIGEKGQAAFLYIIGTMLVASWLAEVIGIEAIIGAFLAGLAYNSLLSNKGPLKNRIEFFGDAFFIPLFLIYVGMQVDVRILTSSGSVWIVIGVLTFTVIAAKWLAAFASAKIIGFSNDQAWVSFGLTLPQAAATLATVFVGMEVGLIGEDILNGAIMTILVTCIIGPIVVERFGYKLAGQSELEEGVETSIHQRIMVPIANPATTIRLVEFASNIKTDSKDPIYPLSVINSYRDDGRQLERAEKTLEQANDHIHAVNSESKPLIRRNLNIASGIREASQKHSITDIVIGWDGRISTRVRVFGSIIDQMLEATTQQVFVCKLNQPIATFKKIRLIISPKRVSNKTYLNLFDTLLRLAENLNASVDIYHTSSEEQQINRYLDFLSPSVSVTSHKKRTYDQLRRECVKDMEDSDLLIATNERSTNYGWTYGTNLVPRMMSEQKPEASFVIAYPDSAEFEPYITNVLY